MEKFKKVFITGSAGFIGKNIEQYLKDKYAVLSPTRKQLDLLDGYKVEKFLKKNKPDVVIHTALVGGSRLDEYGAQQFSYNLRIFFNLVRNRQYFGKMIHIGSGAEYDKSRDIKAVKETDFDKMIPGDYYGFFKYICAKYIEESENIYNLRVFGLWGRHEDWRFRFISNAICRNLKRMPISISQDVYFDYVYVDDFCRIVEYFIKNDGKFKTYNIGTGEKKNLISIANAINRLSQKTSKVRVAKKGLQKEYTCNNARLMNELGDFAFTDFDKALSKMIVWYGDHIDDVDGKYL